MNISSVPELFSTCRFSLVRCITICNGGDALRLYSSRYRAAIGLEIYVRRRNLQSSFFHTQMIRVIVALCEICDGLKYFNLVGNQEQCVSTCPGTSSVMDLNATGFNSRCLCPPNQYASIDGKGCVTDCGAYTEKNFTVFTNGSSRTVYGVCTCPRKN